MIFVSVLEQLLKKKKPEQKHLTKQLFAEQKKFVITEDTPLSTPSDEAKKLAAISDHDLEEKLSGLIQKKQKQKILSGIIPKKEQTDIEKLKESLKKEIQEANAIESKKIVEEESSRKTKFGEAPVPTAAEVENKRALRIVEFFLNQLVDELGADNEFEILKVFRVNDGWKALAKVNGDLYSFDLAINGEIISFEALEAELGE